MNDLKQTVATLVESIYDEEQDGNAGGPEETSAGVKTGLEIATDTGAFATKLFMFATKISQWVAN